MKMTALRMPTALVAAAFLWMGSATGAETRTTTTFARDALLPRIAKGAIPGIVTILHANGLTELNETGYADLETKRAISADQVYAQASQTKGFCGVTVAKLVEEGRLNLDDPVSKYIPQFARLYIREQATAQGQKGCFILRPATNAVTVRMCLNHSAGFPFELPGFEAMGGWSCRMPIRSVALTVATMPLAYQPGSRYMYSNLGIDVAAAVVERVTGQRWDRYLKETVLDPLGMHATSFCPTREQLENRMVFYTILDDRPFKLRRKEGPSPLPHTDDPVYPSAGAGLWTTANDQYKFYKMLFNYGVGDNGVRILKESTVRELLLKSSRPAGQKGTPANLERYSLGFRIFTDKKGLTWFGHGGAYCTGCYMNFERGLLHLRALQVLGYNGPDWGDQLDAATEKFFAYARGEQVQADEKPEKKGEGQSSPTQAPAANAQHGEIVL